MLYKFKSKAAGDVIMTGPVGDKVLRAMGREPATQGILEASALALLLSSLERSVAEDEVRGGGASPEEDGQGQGEGGHTREPGLKQRAWPLVEMMRKSLEAQVDIVWGV